MPFDYNKYCERKGLAVVDHPEISPVTIRMYCDDCFKRWTAVFMTNLTDALECPDCSSMVDIKKGDLSGASRNN